jgi:hypothetical protein
MSDDYESYKAGLRNQHIGNSVGNHGYAAGAAEAARRASTGGGASSFGGGAFSGGGSNVSPEAALFLFLIISKVARLAFALLIWPFRLLWNKDARALNWAIAWFGLVVAPAWWYSGFDPVQSFSDWRSERQMQEAFDRFDKLRRQAYADAGIPAEEYPEELAKRNWIVTPKDAKFRSAYFKAIAAIAKQSADAYSPSEDKVARVITAAACSSVFGAEKSFFDKAQEKRYEYAAPMITNTIFGGAVDARLSKMLKEIDSSLRFPNAVHSCEKAFHIEAN